MNKAEIRQIIKDLNKTSGTNRGWHQRINIAGVWTTTKKVSTAEIFNSINSSLIREDLKDKRILDIGCNAGLFCLEFARRGAKVVGIESKKEWFEQALFVRNYFRKTEGVDYKLVQGLAEDAIGDFGKFDYILLISALRYVGIDRLGFKLTNKLAQYQVEFVKDISSQTNNFIMKTGLAKNDNIDFWAGVLSTRGFFEDSSIIAYPDIPRARQDRLVKRFTRR